MKHEKTRPHNLKSLVGAGYSLVGPTGIEPMTFTV